MTDLMISQVAVVAGCHRNTVLNYEKRGHIQPVRDINGYRRYSLDDAFKLKKILSTRTRGQDE